MEKVVIVLSLCFFQIYALNLSGPLVYVVTPSPQPFQVNEGRSAQFYYHNWMRRMDAQQNTSTTTSTTPKVKTPDLIFAEFESDSKGNMQKSIRKLLEKEKIVTKAITTSTSRPIYVPDEDFISPSTQHKDNKDESDTTYSFNIFNPNNDISRPVYMPKKSQSTSQATTELTTSTTPVPVNVENIWHIIDNEKQDEYSGKWNEIPIDSENDQMSVTNDEKLNEHIDDNFALPGFGTNPGNGAENESRAIRTEPNIRFPYVSLKPFQMKKPNIFSNNKNGKDNMYLNLDNFKEIKSPIRGEVHDQVTLHQSVDRYNPAQPYLPHAYASKSKQSSPSQQPAKAVANLVPPPPPPPPQITADDFPSPTNYESFPPYPPSISDSNLVLSPPSSKLPVSVYKSPSAIDDSISDTSSDNDNEAGPQPDLGYHYQSRPMQTPTFLPTVSPMKKPLNGYSYEKPMAIANGSPSMNTGGYFYNKPAMVLESPSSMNSEMEVHSYAKPQAFNVKPDFNGYHYGPEQESTAMEHPQVSSDIHTYSSHGISTYHKDSDYPELIFDKPHGSKPDDTKGMMPPPPPSPVAKPDLDAGPPPDDHGFPHDFPGDLKYHDIDDHDFHHHHHHQSTTTETPRVNRYSYYYLGKKLYYLPLYFSVYFIVYVGALIIKAILRHKIVYPNSWRPNGTTATFFTKRSIDTWDLSHDNLHEITGIVTKAIGEAAEKYMAEKSKCK